MPARQVDLNEAGNELRVQFPYNRALVEVVRGLSRRRFDPVTKSWSCPVEIVREVVETLLVHGFTLSTAARGLYEKQGGTLAPGMNDSGASADENGASASLLRESGPSAQPARPAAPSANGPADAASVTVSELNARVHWALLRAFPDLLWVVGEIAGFDKNRHRAHVHFELVEKAGDAVGGALKAVVGALLFERTRRELERQLRASEAPFELRDGIEVRLRVRVDFYEPRGSFQLIVEEIDPVHTLGKIAQNRAKVLEELDRRGLRERNRNLPWPEVPLRVGLITSVGSDAWNDFVNELARSGYAFTVTGIDARMQGAGLEKGLVRAIAWFAARAADFDALAIVRGGGAKTDLLWFDNLAVALAVAQCPLKVVSGIGHQRDVSVIDLIAHPEKTPTAAAGAIVAQVQAFEQRLEEAYGALADRVVERLARERERIGRLVGNVARAARGAARVERERLEAAARRLASEGRGSLATARRGLIEAQARLSALTRAQTRLRASVLAALVRRFDRRNLTAWLERRAARLQGLDQLAQSLHPRNVLRRGFAVVRDAAGRTLRDATRARPGDVVVATLAQGELTARVERSGRAAESP